MKNIICCLFIIISFSVYSQVINRNYAYELLKKNVLGLQWSNKEILASKNILAGGSVICTNDTFVVSHTDSSWFFFVDEQPICRLVASM